MSCQIEPESFVATLRPLLEQNNFTELMRTIDRQWRVEQIIQLLESPHQDAGKVALLCLSLIGTLDAVDAICGQLSSDDTITHQLAEHALWSIWFRAGKFEANVYLRRGVRAINGRDFRTATGFLDEAIAIDPQLAEAYNQRAIAFFLMDQYEQSIADCRRAVRLMPCHFGAWAGMGHCFLHLGELPQALRCYEKALEIDPHLVDLRRAADDVRHRVLRQT